MYILHSNSVWTFTESDQLETTERPVDFLSTSTQHDGGTIVCYQYIEQYMVIKAV